MRKHPEDERIDMKIFATDLRTADDFERLTTKHVRYLFYLFVSKWLTALACDSQQE